MVQGAWCPATKALPPPPPRPYWPQKNFQIFLKASKKVFCLSGFYINYMTIDGKLYETTCGLLVSLFKLSVCLSAYLSIFACLFGCFYVLFFINIDKLSNLFLFTYDF